MKKITKQPHIRHTFLDPAHGSRVRLSAASLTNSFQAPILQQEVDHDPIPMDAHDGSSKQSICDIVATNSSALSPRDFPPLNYRLSLTRCRQTSAANTVKSSSSTKTLSALVLALPALGIAHSCRTMSQIRGPLASVMMSS